MQGSFRKRIQGYFLNPFFLALIPSVAIFLITPFQGRKYVLEKAGSMNYPERTRIIYSDLDDDGWSEKIVIFNRFNSSGITLYNKDNTIIDQWNVSGTLDFTVRSALCLTADCDGNGKKEIYFFTLSGDSIMLNSLNDTFSPELSFSNRFIATTGKGINKPDPYIIEAEPDDLNGDGIKELIFGIGTGFSKSPRRIYAYYVQEDSLITSPEAYLFLSAITQADINGDGFREIIPSGYGASNVPAGEAKYHDQSGWLMVLDKNLEFLFEPVEFKGQYSGVTPLIYIDEKETIISALTLRPKSDTASFLIDFDSRGNIKFNKLHYVDSFTGFITHDRQKGPLYVIQQGSSWFNIYNRDKKFIRTEKTGSNPKSFLSDLNNDGEKEIIMLVQDEKKVSVYQPGMTHKTETDLDIAELDDCTFSVKYAGENDPVIALQFGNMHHELIFRKNPHYILAYLVYPLAYAGFFVFVYLILLLQKKAIDKKIATEKKIAELQMAMLRNQLDPHFILNAINSLIYLVHSSETERATEGLRSFSVLYRDMVLTGNETRRSLAEEIEFCRNYLILQKIRYGNTLNYGIYITPGTNLDIPVPKMIIQLYAENGIKHGISKLEKGGHLDIIVSGDGSGYCITITDNGVGRSSTPDGESASTGKGMALMQELFTVYNRYYKEKISVEVIDLYKKEEPAGTKVIISISKH